MRTSLSIILLSIFLIAGGLALPGTYSRAQSIDEIKGKIDARSKEIEALEKEIDGYQKELNALGSEKQSLENEVKTIDITRKKLDTDIKITQNKIAASELTITQLESDIGTKRDDIISKLDSIKESIRTINEIEENSLVELVLSEEDVSAFWTDIEYSTQFQASLSADVEELKTLKTTLEDTKTDVEKEQKNYLALKGKLSDQKSIVDAERAKKNSLLKETANKEANYKKLISEKEELRAQFEKELLDYESQLRVAIDPSSLPPAGKGVLAWPLKQVTITQYFGNTEFAKTGAYNGQGHNGVDFRASIGTEVFAALSGVVTATGNTDQYAGCYSYGKWVLIKHYNGLSTIYAHLSLIKVSSGDTVTTGDLIGYSGNTGYATGPHLHFGVYATQGVSITRLGDIKSKTNCAQASIPVAPLNAYLNPMDYL